MGLRFWSRGIAAILALAFLPNTGCSWLFVNKPYESIYATAPAECTSSVASPVIDTVAAGILAGGGVAAVVYANRPANNPSDSFFSGLNKVGTAGGVVLVVAAVPLAVSAAYGYATTSDCRELKEKRKVRVTQLACVSGVEASCRSLEESKP
jgi:hypothetical protein